VAVRRQTHADRRTANRAGSVARRSGDRACGEHGGLRRRGHAATNALRRTTYRDAGVRGCARCARLAVEPRSQPIARRVPGHRDKPSPPDPSSRSPRVASDQAPESTCRSRRSSNRSQGRRDRASWRARSQEFPAFGPVELRADGRGRAIALRGGARRNLPIRRKRRAARRRHLWSGRNRGIRGRGHDVARTPQRHVQ
jgi:hypothetical protein